MGNYLYSVRAKNIQVDGLTVHALAYLTKPYYDYGWGRMDRASAMLAGKAESYWAGKEAPKYVALIVRETFEEFQSVMAWDGRATCDDTPSFEGSKGTVGFLKRAGRKGWTLATEMYNVDLGTMKGQTLYLRTSGQFFTAEEALAFVNANKQEGEEATVLHSGITNGKCQTTRLAPTWYERLAS
jgi:hypothetical protein